MKKLDASYIKSILQPRKSATHKGNFGHALLIVGSEGKMGAAVISARACLRSGIGLLTVNIPKEKRAILHISIPEAMVIPRKNKKMDFSLFDSIGIGSGIGTTTESITILETLIKTYQKAMILDADALNILSNHKPLLKKIPPGSILTPHPKEFDRLFGMHNFNEERIQTAIKKAKELNGVIILKGHKTIITDGIYSFQNTTGNAGLAKGGSGDALTGIITAFLGQGYSSLESAQLGVYIHGLSADISLKNQSKESMLITDCIENLGLAFNQCLKG